MSLLGVTGEGGEAVGPKSNEALCSKGPAGLSFLGCITLRNLLRVELPCFHSQKLQNTSNGDLGQEGASQARIALSDPSLQLGLSIKSVLLPTITSGFPPYKKSIKLPRTFLPQMRTKHVFVASRLTKIISCYLLPSDESFVFLCGGGEHRFHE